MRVQLVATMVAGAVAVRVGGRTHHHKIETATSPATSAAVEAAT
jgi:hypothetical protein